MHIFEDAECICAYLIDLPEDIEISPILISLAFIRTSWERTNDDQNEKEDSNWAKWLPKKKREQVERVLNIKLAAMQSRSLKLYFVTFKRIGHGLSPTKSRYFTMKDDVLGRSCSALPADVPKG